MELPSGAAVPVKGTLWEPSINDKVTVAPLTVPFNIPEVAHGESPMLMVPKIWVPVWVNVPERKVSKPSAELVLACQVPAKLRTAALWELPPPPPQPTANNTKDIEIRLAPWPKVRPITPPE